MVRGNRIPSEHDLMTQYSCSRMTINKVLSGMAAIGLITRRRRAGSFVAAPQGEHAVMEIQGFATEVARLGHVYRHEVLSRRTERPDAERASALGLPAGSRIVRVRCMHRMNDLPNAYEDRIIALSSVPAAEQETFADITPGTWLLQNVPWTRAEHVIPARNADARHCGMLRLKPRAVCLVPGAAHLASGWSGYRSDDQLPGRSALVSHALLPDDRHLNRRVRPILYISGLGSTRVGRSFSLCPVGGAGSPTGISW